MSNNDDIVKWLKIATAAIVVVGMMTAFSIFVGMLYLGYVLAPDRVERMSQLRSTRLETSVDWNTIYAEYEPYSAGASQAAITILEFSDYECPSCRQFNTITWPALEREFGHRLRRIHVDFPLPNHPNARIAAGGAICAGRQARYWEMHDSLFKVRKIDKATIKRIGARLGLDSVELARCLADGESWGRQIDRNAQLAASLGVSATPTLFLNGKKLVGALEHGAYASVIQELGLNR